MFTFTSSRKREIRKLQLQRNRPVTAKKCTKKGDARCCYAFSINCALFWRSRCFRPRDKLSCIHAITDSVSCRYEKLSDPVWTPMRYVTLHFIGAAQLRTVREISPKSPLLCVNRSSIPYGFLAGAKAILYSVNIALSSLMTLMGMNSVVQVF